jgi:hypothetical protein
MENLRGRAEINVSLKELSLNLKELVKVINSSQSTYQNNLHYGIQLNEALNLSNLVR